MQQIRNYVSGTYSFHKTKGVISLTLCGLLSSCFSQLPAPIEYNGGDGSLYRESTNYSGNSSEVAVTPLNLNDDGAQLQEKPINLQVPGEEPEGYLGQNFPPHYGKEVNLAGQAEDNSGQLYHEVVQGDTLQSIAAQYGTTADAIARANHFDTSYQPQEMELLKVPATKKDVSPARKLNDMQDNTGLTEELGSLGTIQPAQPEQTHPVMPQESFTAAPGYIWPVKGDVVTKFGQVTPHGKSNGINIAAPEGTPVIASCSGKVVHSAFDSKFGNLIIIQSEDGEIFAAYAHMDDLLLTKGHDVAQGDVIGHVGATGSASSSQLHFAIRQNKKPVDPIPFLQGQ